MSFGSRIFPKQKRCAREKSHIPHSHLVCVRHSHSCNLLPFHFNSHTFDSFVSHISFIPTKRKKTYAHNWNREREPTPKSTVYYRIKIYCIKIEMALGCGFSFYSFKNKSNASQQHPFHRAILYVLWQSDRGKAKR